MIETKEILQTAYKALDEKQGEDIVVLDIADISVIADYFIITNGNSDAQISALIDSVDEEMGKKNISIKQQEGNAKGDWVLLDYGDVIIHIFNKDSRMFYNLERIWSDAKRLDNQKIG
ncbi:ribosome-associated protein [Aequitasia blattaphilus]|uniref:Ribosomal silencing factor RsfS n=1 Tax=Aequitasia blattaphilus TaxID=2949332 RepID=A0ABT1E5E8_9FIRM|nr:ribosome silencing factor [Aequitasia blattaphilus]MCP1101065.1 ribosome silencing factor [Aequitasia blattaphilus]MCR8613705.1 ribosome silencing factor [Aequitasia blattaphilus]